MSTPKSPLPVIPLQSSDGQIVTIQFLDHKECGKGAFGVVFPAIIVETGEKVAIKRVVEDERYLNRELQIMKTLFHPNVVKLKRYWEEKGPSHGTTLLSLVMEYVPDTVHRVIRHYGQHKSVAPLLITKLYMYQICRGLGYMHSRGICHRDIKPHNLLCNSKTHVLKICDFGTSKQLMSGKPSIAYICSRFYRAPELVFGCTEYSCAIDVWSAGCVFAELMHGSPIFAGATSAAQKVEIIKILGTPSKDQLMAMNPEAIDTDIPMVSKQPWSTILKGRASPEAIDLLEKMLSYDPFKRITAVDALAHPFFDELRHPATKLPSGEDLPPLFNITADELSYIPLEVLERIVPPHQRTPDNWPGTVPTSLIPTPSFKSGDGTLPRPPIDVVLPSPIAAPLSTGASTIRTKSTGISTTVTSVSSPTAPAPAPTPIKPALTPGPAPATGGIASKTLGLFTALRSKSTKKPEAGTNATPVATKSNTTTPTTAGAGTETRFGFLRAQPVLRPLATASMKKT